MKTYLTAVAIRLARWWTRAYTVGTPGDLAYARRAEIEADIWEFERDVQRSDQGAATAWARLLLGVPDDLSWRLEQGISARAILWMSPLVVGMLLSIFWVVVTTQARDLPLLPPAPPPFAREAPRLPPPPPPPPRSRRAGL
jgi:hypothetical protein